MTLQSEAVTERLKFCAVSKKVSNLFITLSHAVFPGLSTPGSLLILALSEAAHILKRALNEYVKRKFS